MKIKQQLADIRTKSHDALILLRTELKEKHRVARTDLRNGKSKKPEEARRMKKDIARIETVLNQNA